MVRGAVDCTVGPRLDGRVMLASQGVDRLLHTLADLLASGRLSDAELHAGLVHGLQQHAEREERTA